MRSPTPMNPLTIASFAFTASDDIAVNAQRIHTAVGDAAKAGAQVLLTPECSLIGYPSAARADLSAVDWCRVGDEEEGLEIAARKANVVLVLGTAGPFRSATHYSNDALVLNAGPQPQRYRKQSLTPADEQHFIPGDSPMWVTVAGWKLGLSICYEMRFGHLWAAQARAGVDAFIHIAHMAGGDLDPGTKAEVIPNIYSARAAEWATPLIVCNTAAEDRWLASGHWDARGILVDQCAEGLMLTTVKPRRDFASWYQSLREEALRRAFPS
jgi:predicted amidohydrolase